MLRSGAYARFRYRFSGAERAILAHPDHSLYAARDVSPELGPWTFWDDDGQATPQQAYQVALSKVVSFSSNNAFLASHGGAELLQYPQILKQEGMLPDLEVARLSTSTDLGYPMITLGLRSPPEVREADRQAFTFVFAADDSFVLRSRRYELPIGKLVADCRLEYDHLDGRPVLPRSS